MLLSVHFCCHWAKQRQYALQGGRGGSGLIFVLMYGNTKFSKGTDISIIICQHHWVQIMVTLNSVGVLIYLICQHHWVQIEACLFDMACL